MIEAVAFLIPTLSLAANDTIFTEIDKSPIGQMTFTCSFIPEGGVQTVFFGEAKVSKSILVSMAVVIEVVDTVFVATLLDIPLAISIILVGSTPAKFTIASIKGAKPVSIEKVYDGGS